MIPSATKIGGMRRPGGARPCIAVVLAIAMIASCDRPDAPATVETAGPTAAPAVPAEPPEEASPGDLASMIVVPGESAGAGIVIYPNAPTARLVASAPLRLLAPSGDTAFATASLVMTDSQVCGEAPLVRVHDSSATAWSVGILGAAVSPIHMDSIEAMSRADSSRLAAQLARLASAVPMQSNSRFKGLPFAVLSARRFRSEGGGIVVSHLVRRVPHEADPAEEHTFVVGERDTTAGSSQYTLAYHLRSEGTEDTADNFEVLAAVASRDLVWLLLARDNMARTMYQVLERAASGGWRSRWSRVLSC